MEIREPNLRLLAELQAMNIIILSSNVSSDVYESRHKFTRILGFAQLLWVPAGSLLVDSPGQHDLAIEPKQTPNHLLQHNLRHSAPDHRRFNR